ncbi:hypothetical protein AKJ62_00115 [candidate division MSBL1 archaeon SCGC-AAA259D14]|uniref:Major facilitator superfamily (MFS) profile domain-containing protein n=2 Tax=candidate division MSBL1 TaxID=215777 RepID=A0A133U943_9EURY|nr:hypothetical protein AKJ62_00115 [candidate division MSBL1 archaeon SCGC-AAA259D14]
MKKHLWLIILFSIFSTLLVAMILPYIPLYGKDIGLPVVIIGYVIAVYHLVQVIGRIPLGTLSDVIGYRTVIGIGGASLFLGTGTYILSSSFWPLMFLAQILLGIAVSMTYVTIPAYITHFGQEKVPIYTFIMGWAYTLAVPLGGFLKETMGMDFLFSLAFIFSIPALLIVVLLWKTKPSDDKNNVKKLNSLSVISVYKSAFKTLENPKVLRACLYSFLMFMNFTIGFSLFPLRLSGIGLTATLIGLVQFSRMGTGSSVRLLSKKIEGKINREKILTFGTAIVGLSLVLIPMLESLVTLILISIIWGLSGGLYAPIVFDMIADSTEIKDRGRGMGLRGTMGTLGSSLGVICFSNIADILSIPISISLAGVAIVIGVILIEILLR